MPSLCGEGTVGQEILAAILTAAKRLEPRPDAPTLGDVASRASYGELPQAVVALPARLPVFLGPAAQVSVAARCTNVNRSVLLHSAAIGARPDGP